jgi:DNA-binding NtrC family response regulator
VICIADAQVRRAFSHGSEIKELTDQASDRSSTDSSQQDCGKPVQRLLRTIEQIAESEFPLLIVGEVGTGKEWTARRIHQASAKSNTPFVCVNCIEFIEESFDNGILGYQDSAHASGGTFEILPARLNGATVFLDKISDLPMPARRKLANSLRLRFTHLAGKEKPVAPNLRFIASWTRRSEGPKMRTNVVEEVFYRMSSIIINLPPLRERSGDIPELIDYFLRESNHRLGTKTRGISPEALDPCLAYYWPGNIQQLKNAIEYSTLMNQDGLIQPRDLPFYVRSEQNRTI